MIASCAFGIEGEAFTNPKSDFRLMATSIFAPNSENMLSTFIMIFLPQLSSIFGTSFISKELDKWLRSIVNQIIDKRKETGEVRKDYLQTFIELRKKDTENSKEGIENGSLLNFDTCLFFVVIDEDLIVGQALTFITDGIETSSTLITYALYEIARHPDIMQRAQEEIDDVYERHGGQMSEEGIMELEYMEQIFMETLRMHSAVFTLSKIATKDYTFPPQFSGSSSQLSIRKGTRVIIPVNSIHYDDTYYPQPHSFDPSRFTEEHKKSRHRYAFLGFGEGPRICLGQKFGIYQTKAALSAILRHFDVTLSPKTIIPPPVSKKVFILACEEGIWVKFQKRNTTQGIK